MPPSYVPNVWHTGDTITEPLINHLETQYAAALLDAKFSLPYVLNNVDNTTTPTDALHFTVPGGLWGDGDVFLVQYTALAKNNKGSLGFATFEVNVGIGSLVTVASPQAFDDPNEYLLMLGFTMQRFGSTVAITDLLGAQLANPWSGSAARGTSSPANFTSDQVVTLTITLDAANTLFYVHPQTAVISHFRN